MRFGGMARNCLTMGAMVMASGLAQARNEVPASARADGAQADSAATSVEASARSSLAPGAAFPDKANVGGRAVALNGAGIRYRAVFQVYRAALYTEKPIERYAQLAGAAEAKRIHMVMLREVNANELGTMFVRGILENMDKSVATRLTPAMLRMSALFNEYKRLEPGDAITLDWVPGKGTVVTVKGKVASEPIPEAEFYHALAGIWIGATPADWKLRDAMLGVSGSTETANRN